MKRFFFKDLKDLLSCSLAPQPNIIHISHMFVIPSFNYFFALV